MIVHNMGYLLLKVLLEAAWSGDQAAVDLAAQQDKDAGGDGEDRHNHVHARKAEFEQCDQSGQDQPDAEQQHADTSGDSHFRHANHLLTGKKDGRRACDPGYPSGWVRIV